MVLLTSDKHTRRNGIKVIISRLQRAGPWFDDGILRDWVEANASEPLSAELDACVGLETLAHHPTESDAFEGVRCVSGWGAAPNV